MVILLHSSKTMKAPSRGDSPYRAPQLIDRAAQLDQYLKTLTPGQIARAMAVSGPLAEKTHAMIAGWDTTPEHQSLAIDSFVGDIYSGLHVGDLSPADRDYADEVLYILSGLYGVVRPYDGISPYRLEMGYRLPDPAYTNLYKYWGGAIAECLPDTGLIVNLASVEYAKTVTPYVDAGRVVAPKFLTQDPKTGEPTFVVVHAKIARGAYAHWLIRERITEREDLKHFAEIGYHYDAALSTPEVPTFVCQTFGGLGLSVRLN